MINLAGSLQLLILVSCVLANLGSESQQGWSCSAVEHLPLKMFDLKPVAGVSGMMQYWSLPTVCAESLLFAGLVWGPTGKVGSHDLSCQDPGLHRQGKPSSS